LLRSSYGPSEEYLMKLPRFYSKQAAVAVAHDGPAFASFTRGSAARQKAAS